MTWRNYALLVLLGLTLFTIAGLFQSTPGYIDADYYYAGGIQLAQGNGFTEPYLWNYLDDPIGLPHPSFAYWMPLASILAAAGAFLFKQAAWWGGRAGFILVAAFVPPVTAAIAWSLTKRRDLAWMAGLLAVFPAFYLPFLAVTDTFGLYMLFGGLFVFLLLQLSSENPRLPAWLLCLFLGGMAGLMHLSRTDGLLWLLVAVAAIIYILKPGHSIRSLLLPLFMALLGYLLVMMPWFIRNLRSFGSPLGPGGTKMLWQTTYDQLFAFPASQLSFTSWWRTGLQAILKARLWALGVNLERTLAEQGEIFLFPLIIVGSWSLRRFKAVQAALLGWCLTFLAMTFAFPYAGARGGFFHSGAALQPLWWAAAPIGLERVLQWGKEKRGWDPALAGRLFRPALIVLALCLTLVVGGSRLTMKISGLEGHAWDQESTIYSHISTYLAGMGASSSDIVMVANPPGYYLASGNSAIAIPYGDVSVTLEVAKRYGASYLILEPDSVPTGLWPVYEHPTAQTGLVFLDEVDGARIYLLRQP